MRTHIEFTQEELKVIARALTFGIIHTNNPKERAKFKELETTMLRYKNEILYTK